MAPTTPALTVNKNILSSVIIDISGNIGDSSQWEIELSVGESQLRSDRFNATFNASNDPTKLILTFNQNLSDQYDSPLTKDLSGQYKINLSLLNTVISKGFVISDNKVIN